MKRLVCKILLAFGSIGVISTSTASAIDPLVGLPYAWGLGAQYAFRNRMPTPPYFSIYSPVYYGARYQRPYGDSPYASPYPGPMPMGESTCGGFNVPTDMKQGSWMIMLNVTSTVPNACMIT